VPKSILGPMAPRCP